MVSGAPSPWGQFSSVSAAGEPPDGESSWAEANDMPPKARAAAKAAAAASFSGVIGMAPQRRPVELGSDPVTAGGRLARW